ncbi:type IV secretion system protein [Rhodanobacter geophilus]|uniref:Type IV secretion system protein n=1 Tax=Rhodanobacter geophilus TaxID=3162488 RepID=A0ABV3QSN2_9GAMM
MPDLGKFVFFTIINNYLSNQINSFQWDLLQRTSMVIGAVALVVLTIWIVFHGYRIITGQSREPMMALVGDSLKAVLVVGIATSMAGGSQQLYWALSDGTSAAIVQLVTGKNASPFQSIDDNLAAMQLGMSTIDTIEDGGNARVATDLTRDKWMSGAGVAGPAVIAGALLLLNKIALALFIGFGPMFIMCLLFRQTAPLFQKWLLYGIGTVFSLAVLSVMITLSMQMLTAITASYIAQYVASMATQGGLSTDGLNSMALQQGGIGLILTTLIISAPPMAAAFFQGTLGQVNFFSPFGRIGEGMASSRQQMALGTHRYQALPPGNANTTVDPNSKAGNTPQITGPSGLAAGGDTVKSYNPNIGRFGG